MMRKHFFVIIVAVLLAATVFIAGCASTTPSPSVSPLPTRDPTFVPKNTSGYLTYSNRSAGITIQYPPSWQVTQGQPNATASFGLGTTVSFTVIAPENYSGASMTLDDYSQGALSGIAQSANLTDFKLLNSSNITLAGYPAQKHVFTYMNEGTTSQGLLELTLVNRTGYGLLYVATQSDYPAYLGIAQNMTQSFNIVG